MIMVGPADPDDVGSTGDPSGAVGARAAHVDHPRPGYPGVEQDEPLTPATQAPQRIDLRMDAPPSLGDVIDAPRHDAVHSPCPRGGYHKGRVDHRISLERLFHTASPLSSSGTSSSDPTHQNQHPRTASTSTPSSRPFFSYLPINPLDYSYTI